jgi:hypothetical protein
MEIFKFLGEIKNAEVTTSVVQENVYPELNGTITLSKGILKVEYTWYGRVTPMYKMEDYITIDDLEFEGGKENIEGLEIDNFHQFRQGLIDHGMKSVAESLTIDDSIIREEIYKTIPKHKYYKALYGDKKIFSTLSDEEKRKAYVQAMSNDITFRENDKYMKSSLGWVKDNDEGVVVILTNAEIIEQYYK